MRGRNSNADSRAKAKSWCNKYPNGECPPNERRLLERVKKLCKRLGIDGTIHSFRKFFCSYFANQGVPPLTLMSWSGHSDIKVLIASYYRLNEEDSLNFMRKVCRTEKRRWRISRDTSGTNPGTLSKSNQCVFV